jgi:hypothetical protein
MPLIDRVGIDMGICAACQQAAAVAALPVLTAAAGQQTLWHPVRVADRLAVLPWGPCQRGGIAASRPRPPVSARVGAIGCAGARTRRRDTMRALPPGYLYGYDPLFTNP